MTLLRIIIGTATINTVCVLIMEAFTAKPRHQHRRASSKKAPIFGHSNIIFMFFKNITMYYTNAALMLINTQKQRVTPRRGGY